MALSSAQVWEVRAAGSDLNGGAFKAGASGTDYSQQDGPQVTYADLAIDATLNTKVTSAANPFTSAHVGNVLNVTAGTGFTTGRYEVVSVAASVATLDRAVGTISSTGGVGNLGGALLTLGTLAASMVAANKAWVKGGTYGITAALTFAQTVVSPTPTSPPTRLFGYATVRGDVTKVSTNQSSRPAITVNAALGAAALTFSGTGFHLRHFIVANGTGSFTNGIASTSNKAVIYNCKVSGHSTYGITVSGTTLTEFCEVTAGQAGSTAAVQLLSTAQLESCYIHDTPSHGVANGGSGSVAQTIIANCTGAVSDGVSSTNTGEILNCTIYGSGRHGINVYGSNLTCRVLGNILANCGGYGLTDLAGAGIAASPETDGNAFYSNTSGSRNNLDDTTINPVDGVTPYVNAYDVTLTASPFVNAAVGDYRLNNSAGAGAACRGAAPMNALPGLASTGYRDMGAIQHQDFGITNVSFLEG